MLGSEILVLLMVVEDQRSGLPRLIDPMLLGMWFILRVLMGLMV